MTAEVTRAPTIKLNNGVEMPAFGYGTWLGLNDKMEFDATGIPKLVEAMSYAIDIGYRHIDTAHLYRVEPEVGDVIAQKIKDGVVTREQLFVTTKVWHHFHKPDQVEVSLRASLTRMHLDYVDQLLMHWPMSITEDGVDEKIDYLETWKGFETVLKKGLAKSIGVSNFNLQQMQRLLANCSVPPAANQVEINLNLEQVDLVNYCLGKGVVIVAHTPFGTMVPTKIRPNSPSEPKMDNPVLAAIGAKHRKTPAQVALRYLHQRGVIPIPKTVTKTRVLENLQIFDSKFVLDASDMAELAKFDVGFRTVRPIFWQEYTNYPFDKLEGVTIPVIPLYRRKWKNGKNLDID